MKKTVLRDMLITAGIFILAFWVSLIFLNVFNIYEHISTLFAFAVFLISVFTRGYVWGIAAALLGTLAINYAFTFPYLAFDFITPVNFISAVVMITIALLTSALTTKLKRHEAMKSESEKERMRANLLRAVSHDIRTPLTTIYGSAATLEDNWADLSDDQKLRMLNGIKEDSDWLVRIVENLLSVTRFDENNVKIVKTSVVLDELVDSALQKFKKRCPGQDVTVYLPDEIVMVHVDVLLIEQVIINLLDNAVRHAEGMTELIFRVYTGQNGVVFEIEDNGCGISAEKIIRIFDGCSNFEDSLPDGKKKNAGIGLAVCASIVKAHGGRISVDSTVGKGSVFRFVLKNTELKYE